MEKFLQVISDQVSNAFAACGYDSSYGKVTVSNRPDLCEYQCNGAMAAAKKYRKAPFMIADEVVKQLKDCDTFEEIVMVKPGFINMKLSSLFVANYLNQMAQEEKLGVTMPEQKETIVIDYGGPNVAKPLHIGHLRSAIIGESLKRICRFMGHEVIGDAHLGDWGLQMGLVIEELKERRPELCYFDESYEGEYPAEAPFTISELEEIYPCASAKSKVNEEFAKKAHDATVKLQDGHRGYTAIWNHIMNVSVTDLKKNYQKLDVSFDMWGKESDAQPFIPSMIDKMKAQGITAESEGALVVEVKEDSDKKEIPPCILVKSDGGYMYPTTDLATIVQREQDFKPNQILYVVDKRQEMHFIQVFRTARKAGLVPEETNLQFLGFGTMNGKDGKPFKTRAGGVMRLETLLNEVHEAVKEKMSESRSMEECEMEEISGKIALAAIKYGDLSNQAAKDYVFDMERFISFEGNTGPYILYTIVRIKSILARYLEEQGDFSAASIILNAENASEKALMLSLTGFNEMMETVYRERAPHKICAYIYELSNEFNRFYHETKILSEENAAKKASYIALLLLAKQVLETCIDLLGFEAPDKM
ncbi:MAG: arginine--tRNA ligase [Lachnospiraceae bacterium]